MSGRRRWTALALVTAAAACSDIAHPTRDEVYEWRYITLNATGTGLDSLSFHWPAARLPVKVWAEGAAGLPDNLPKAIAAGVRIACGTDAPAIPHGENAKELRALVDRGMTPMQALRAATITSAELIDADDELGRLAPGYLADIIAVPGDPSRDITVLAEIFVGTWDGLQLQWLIDPTRDMERAMQAFFAAMLPEAPAESFA